MSTADAAPGKKKRFARLRETWGFARQADPAIGRVVLAVFLGTLAIVVLVGWALGEPAAAAFIGIPLALLVTLLVFNRRVTKASYRLVEGRPGAAGGVLSQLRRGWTVTPAVAVTREQDLVHRVVGRPGIVLVGEGSSPQRIARLLTQERRRHSRVALDTPVVEVVVGDSEGAVPLPKLLRHVQKLPRRLSPAQITEVNSRLKALRSQPIPVPKGPMPRNARIPRSGGGLPGR